MSENKPQNELAKSTAGFIDKYGDKLWSGVKSVSKKIAEEVRRDWRVGYEHYLNKAGNKYYYAKTFLTYNQPRPLYDLYVPLSVTCGKDLKEETSINDLLEVNRYSIMMATGGSGKTMMMRHLFVDSIENTSQVPIFVELRDLNNTELTLFDLIKKKLKDFEFNFGDEYLEVALQAGHFTLLLDGFDEVADAKRKATMQQIDDIADKYEKNNIILSSRPDESLNQWERFNIWQVQPLTLEQACELVKRTDTDEEIEEKFTKALKEELYEKHQSFLANPLLLAIMLITYKDSAKIPEKISTFYEQAYTALFYQHDARKAFDRPKRTNLDMLDFKKVFSAFCFFTYHKSIYSFTQTEIFDYLEKAKKYTGINFTNRDFLQDLLQSVCLMVRDGLDITFSHRSFQEYFAAIFVSKMEKSEARKTFINIKYIKNPFGLISSGFLNLLLEISIDIVETDLLIPCLENLEVVIGMKNTFGEKEYESLINYLYSKFRLVREYDSEANSLWKINTYVASSNYDNIVEFIVISYLPNNSYNYDKFINILLSKYNENDDIHFECIMKNEKMKTSLLVDSPFRKSFYKKVLNVKNILIEKHKNKDNFLEDEILN